MASFIREIIENTPSSVVISIPAELQGSRVEILILPVGSEGVEATKEEATSIQKSKRKWPPGLLESVIGSMPGFETLPRPGPEAFETREEVN